jgi:hypothetical protein
MDAEHLTGLKTFFVTKLPTENTLQPTSGGDMIAICTHRIHERFRKEWFEILDTREHNSFHFNHSPCSNICFWTYFFHYSNKLYYFLV